MHAGAAEDVTVRAASEQDDARLLEIDRATRSPMSSPAPAPQPDGSFFDEKTLPDDVLIAELDGAVAGWVKIEHPTPLPASRHVWLVTGLAVDPAVQGRGVGRALMEAAVATARQRGGRRITLRVFAPNRAARRLYEGLGFEVEGVMRGEFRAGDDYIDDVLMALDLTHPVTPST